LAPNFSKRGGQPRGLVERGSQVVWFLGPALYVGETQEAHWPFASKRGQNRGPIFLTILG